MVCYRVVLGLGLAVSLLISACSGGDDDVAGTPTDDEVLAAVTQALHEEHGLEPGALEVSLDRVQEGKYASGGARDEFSGAMWFAALVDGEWRIVWDGNGVIDCANLEPYPEFPVSMIPACLDFKDGTLHER